MPCEHVNVRHMCLSSHANIYSTVCQWEKICSHAHVNPICNASCCVYVCVFVCVCPIGGGCTVADLWCNRRQMGEMAETNLKGLIHLITTTEDCRLPHSSNLLFVCRAAGAPIMLAYMENAYCAIFLMKQHQLCALDFFDERQAQMF